MELKSLLARWTEPTILPALDQINSGLALKRRSFQFNFNVIALFKSFQDFQLHSYKDFSSSPNVETDPARLILLHLIL
jgi:hypothetical protein